MPDFPSVTQLAIPFFILAMLAEIVFVRFFKAKGEFETRDTLTSLMMGVGNVAMGLVFGFISYGILTWFWQFRFADLGVSWWVGLGAFLIDDLRYYWYHRIAHRMRWFWAEHINHHSSQHYNLSTALRQSWTGSFTGAVLLQVPLVLLGVHPAFLAFVYGFNLVYQFWIHTERIGTLWRPFEFVFNTPSHHRVHHGMDPEYLDKNFGGILIIWDRLFGSFQPETFRPHYGLTKPVNTFNIWTLETREYVAIVRDVRSAGRWRDKLGYIFGPPGWEPARAGTPVGAEG